MIKEIGFKKNNKTNERINNSVEIDTIMEQPFKLNIELLNEVEYFNEKLSNNSIKITNEIPNADWIPVDRWIKLVCVSKKFRDIFENKLKSYWYPTNNKDYFILLLNNCINGLDEDKTIIVNNKEKPYRYESIDNLTFKSNIEDNEYLFIVPQEPLRKLSTSKFESIYRENNLTGIQFYKDINFKKIDKSEDLFRFKLYDDDGNCLE
jgi:hypothetical protein